MVATPTNRWMVYKGKSDLEMHNLGVPHGTPISGNLHITIIGEIPMFIRCGIAYVPCMRVKICLDMGGNVIRVSSSYFPAFCRTMVLVHDATRDRRNFQAASVHVLSIWAVFKTQSIILSWWLVYGDSRWRFWIMKISNKLGSITTLQRSWTLLIVCLVWNYVLYILWHSQTIWGRMPQIIQVIRPFEYWNILWFSGYILTLLPMIFSGYILRLFWDSPILLSSSLVQWMQPSKASKGQGLGDWKRWLPRASARPEARAPLARIDLGEATYMFWWTLILLGNNENRWPGIEYISWISFQIGGFTPTEECWIARRLKPR